MGNENSLKVHVLFRFSKKTGKIDTTMTGLGSAMMEMWCLNNTPKTKSCLVCERDSGKIVFLTAGTDNGFPKVKSVKKHGDLGSIEDFGIPLSVVQQECVDSRFD